MRRVNVFQFRSAIKFFISGNNYLGGSSLKIFVAPVNALTPTLPPPTSYAAKYYCQLIKTLDIVHSLNAKTFLVSPTFPQLSSQSSSFCEAAPVIFVQSSSLSIGSFVRARKVHPTKSSLQLYLKPNVPSDISNLFEA